MSLVWITVIIGLISIVFCAISLKRLYRYIHKYQFDESKYTLLFGFIRLRYFAGLYIIIAIAFAVVSTAFMIYIIL